jgi:hypothetical protein
VIASQNNLMPLTNKHSLRDFHHMFQIKYTDNHECRSNVKNMGEGSRTEKPTGPYIHRAFVLVDFE